MEKIIVYGPGCSKCQTLSKMVQQMLSELGYAHSVEKVTDPMLFAVAGVLMTPALSIDGKIVLSGKVPSHEELKHILVENLGGGAYSKENITELKPSEEEKSCCCKHKNSATSETKTCSCESTANEQKSCDCEIKEEPNDYKDCCCQKKSEEKTSCCSGEKETGGFNRDDLSDNCGCSCGCKKKGAFKKIVVAIVVLILLLAVVKGLNHQKSVSVPTQENSENVSSKEPGRIDLVYYIYGSRCITCVRMEKWTNEVVKGDFSKELEQGLLTFKSVEATPQDVEKYGLTTKSLVVKVVEKGKEVSSERLEEIWNLSRDEEAFKAYVRDQVKLYLSQSDGKVTNKTLQNSSKPACACGGQCSK